MASRYRSRTLFWTIAGAALGVAGGAALDVIHFGPEDKRATQATAAAEDGLDGLRIFLDTCADHPGVHEASYNSAIARLNAAQDSYRSGEIPAASEHLEAGREFARRACHDLATKGLDAPGGDAGRSPGQEPLRDPTQSTTTPAGADSTRSPDETGTEQNPATSDGNGEQRRSASPREIENELQAEAGNEPVPIPNVVGVSWQKAAELLANDGFVFDFRHQVVDTAADEAVVGQSPAAGTLARPCCIVVEVTVKAPELEIAQPHGIPRVMIPEVVGLPLSDAVEILGSRLRVEYVDVGDHDKRHDIVLGQYPPPGEISAIYLEKLVYVGRSTDRALAAEEIESPLVETTTTAPEPNASNDPVAEEPAAEASESSSSSTGQPITTESTDTSSPTSTANRQPTDTETTTTTEAD